MTLMADEGGLVQMGSNPLFEGSALKSQIAVSFNKTKPGVKSTYKRSNLASIQVEDDVCCMMGNWVLADGPGSEEVESQRPRGLSLANY